MELKKSYKNKNDSHKIERKKGELIELKTDLQDVPINISVNNFKSLSVNEILNQPAKEKKKFGIKLFNKGVRKGFLNNSLISPEVSKPNLEIFNTMEILSQPLFKASVNKTVIHNNNKNNTFKILLKENYSHYIKSLKKIYPSFKFNHYKKITKEYSDYIKKYGEDSDINTRHYHSENNGEILSFRFNNKTNDKKEYKKSNLLEILGAQENIECDPKDFKIKDDFLSRTNISELKMIQKDLQFKTSVIDKELDFILMNYPQKLYNYIEKNKDLTNKIKEYQVILIQRRFQKKRVIYNYLNNSGKLMLKEHKKKQDIKVYILLKEIEKIHKSMKELKNISLSQSENKIKEVNDAINKVKDYLKKFNNKYNKEKKYKFISEIEKIIQQYENQGEENLNDQFNFNIKKLINNCLIYLDKGNEIQGNDENNNKELVSKWDLSKENDIKNNIIFVEKDFNLTEEEDKIFVKFLLIYNNINSKNDNILKLLISILDMFEIIIKDNLDINVIVSVFQDVFIKLVNKNFEIIQNITKNKLLMIKIASNCFSTILSNYFYIIMLIQNNFGFRIKIFGEVTELIKKEMDKYIMELINDFYKDILSVNHWKYFIYETKSIKNNIKPYFDCRNLNLFKLVINQYEIYLNNFKLQRKKELDDNINEKSLDLTQEKNIDLKFQKMFDILVSNKDILKLNFEEIGVYKSKKEENNTDEISNESRDFICIKDEKNNINMNHKVSRFSLEIINFLYDCLLVFVELTENLTYNIEILKDKENNFDNEIDNGLRNDLIKYMYKEIKEKLLFSKDLTINNKTGKVNNKEITDKETCLYYSDIIIIENNLNIFLTYYPEEELSSSLNELKMKCVDLIIQLINDTTNKIFEDFNSLNFTNYPIVNAGKGYNKYVNYFTVIKRIYDSMCNCFTKIQINEIIKDDLQNLFNKISQSIEKKGIIDNEEQLKQIRNEFNYIKKVFKLFHDIDTNNLKELIDDLIIKVNPDKLPVSKKKKGGQNKDKEKDEKE